MGAKKGTISVGVALSGNERIERKEKKDQTETDEKNALVLFGIMFSGIREGDDILDRLAEIFSEKEKK